MGCDHGRGQCCEDCCQDRSILRCHQSELRCVVLGLEHDASCIHVTDTSKPSNSNIQEQALSPGYMDTRRCRRCCSEALSRHSRNMPAQLRSYISKCYLRNLLSPIAPIPRKAKGSPTEESLFLRLLMWSRILTSWSQSVLGIMLRGDHLGRWYIR